MNVGPKAAASGSSEGGGFSGGEMTSTRKTLMWSFLGGAAVGIVVGTVFGILDLQAENDYKNTPSNQQSAAGLDPAARAARRGHRRRRLDPGGGRRGRRGRLRVPADLRRR